MRFEPWSVFLLLTCGAGSVMGVMTVVLLRDLEKLRAELRTQQIDTGNKLGVLESLTCVDSLTGLRNQQAFEIRVSALLRGTLPFVLIYIDLDGLKAVNDRRGHAEGDRLIRSAVKAIRSAVGRKHDLDSLFRRGTAADEFLWVLEGVRIDMGIKRAGQILTALQSVGVSASIGVMEWDAQKVLTVVQIELAAEQQMQRAKREGGNRVCAEAVVEHDRPAALPLTASERATDSVPDEIPVEVVERTEVTERTERTEVTERNAA